ncbi:hypothetical protein JRQ81_002692 [Phrynocephalus forsythii]|uniref:Uncharacterized protein n=1 Tax=Phrynocephalus forsythii TaxID=171643 RepID=A0A9Q1AWQ5_9SAUR|nr:hypothetical protein JRQ81_002692 [Phrynocephalus forsythii]
MAGDTAPKNHEKLQLVKGFLNSSCAGKEYSPFDVRSVIITQFCSSFDLNLKPCIMVHTRQGQKELGISPIHREQTKERQLMQTQIEEDQTQKGRRMGKPKKKPKRSLLGTNQLLLKLHPNEDILIDLAADNREQMAKELHGEEETTGHNEGKNSALDTFFLQTLVGQRKRQIGIIIAHFGLSTQSLLVSGQRAKTTFKQRALDVSAQQDMELLSKNRALSWLSKNKLVFKCEKYLTISLPYSLRRAYTRLRFELLESMNKFGHFHNLPYHERTCICSAPAIEDIAHILFDCELYTALRQSYLSKMMAKIAHWNVNFQLAFLLQSSNVHVFNGVANFISKAARVRSSYIDQFGIYCRGDADS